jgi:RNA polymerase sigma-70 factor (ECF subfamily)
MWSKKQLIYTTNSMAERPVTALLQDWRRGNQIAGKELFELMQPELRRIASGYMQRERSGHTLQPTALVNELFLKLIGGASVEWQDRAHFLAIASQQLRRILVDHAREHQAKKRGGEWQATTLVEQSTAARPFEEDLLDLHHALDELSALDPRAAQVIELRYFGGLTEKESAEVLRISVATLKRDWEAGRAWLIDRLGWGQTN